MYAEESNPTSRWRQNADGSWDPTRFTSSTPSDGGTDTGMTPADILAGDNITVVANPGGTVTISGRDQQTTVYRQDFRPSDPKEGDYWIRDHPGVDVTPAGLLTDETKWTALGFGYPPGASASPGPDGMSIVWTLGGSGGQQMAFNMGFVDKHVYRVEVDVSPLTGAAKQLRLVWAFVRDSAIYELVSGQDTTLVIDIPWNTGQNQWVMLQSPDSDLGGGIEVKAVRVLDVTNDPSEAYVYDDPTGWTFLGGGGGGGADEVAIQTAAPTVQPGPYPRLWIDTDEPDPPAMLPVAGGQMTGPLLLSRDPVLPMEPLTKQWYDGHAVDPANFLLLSGGTMTGTLVVPSIEETAMLALGSGAILLEDAPGGSGFGEAFADAPETGGWYVQTWRPATGYALQRIVQGYVDDPATYQRVQIAGAWKPWQILHRKTAWTALTLKNNWQNYGGEFQTAQYRKVGDEVQVRGLVRLGTTATAIATLPDGFRPPATLLFGAIHDVGANWATGAASTGTAHTHSQTRPSAAAYRINVNAAGDITHYSTQGTGYVDLSMIRFSVEG